MRHIVRIVTSASLFDGHDAAVNIIRRVLQSSGAEVVHLGHNRSVDEIVSCAIQEDVQAIALTSYQGGHLEFFKYMYDRLKAEGAPIRIFGGGGGTILPNEIQELQDYGIVRVYSPDDGRTMGLQGMIDDVLKQCDFATIQSWNPKESSQIHHSKKRLLAQAMTVIENQLPGHETLEKLTGKKIPVVGFTGTGGAGKSSLVDECVRRFLRDYPNLTLAVLSVDPTKKKGGGALLGDRIRMNSVHHPNVFMRSFATRQSGQAVSRAILGCANLCKVAGFDLIILETSGIGQSGTEIVELSDLSAYVMTPEYGAATQLEKIDMIDFADLIALNKFDKAGSQDALRDVRKQYTRSRQTWNADASEIPVYGTMASQFNDRGTEEFYRGLVSVLAKKGLWKQPSATAAPFPPGSRSVMLPSARVRYLDEIVENHAKQRSEHEKYCEAASQWYRYEGALEGLKDTDPRAFKKIEELRDAAQAGIPKEYQDQIKAWPEVVQRYAQPKYRYEVRGQAIEQDLFTESLSRLKIPKVSLPRYRDWGDLLRWISRENLPGLYPYTAGVFPLKRTGEDPTRMFAGEGGPERTNRRFHYLSRGLPTARLSTAFDSVTLYGENPSPRPDIYGKVGNSGVSVATLDDAKKLYSGFDLCDPRTSVSMTINGPAPIVLAFFLNAAIDQQVEKHLRSEGKLEAARRIIQEKFKRAGVPVPQYGGALPEGNEGLGLALLGVSGDEVVPPEVYSRIAAFALTQVRGTVQADILKEDQAQNTCIFSTEFALKMMGDVQEYFIEQSVRNFYSVSISGYHIAEAGANPITQLALTLANGFTYVEYYRSRGLDIDDFAPNLSFFFSNGMDPEYTVIGRVARRIWATAMRHIYKGNDRSQKLKYHIQTSGRSLHAQEISFNDIRTTLQALCAIYDNCNSLHTNAYDEAITTPTEESVRRALAIQLIINQELGLARNENPLQGSFIIEELTDLVEEAVLKEFSSLSARGGVLGAMERMYQRSKIQEESLYYESLKHDGRLPIIGVNTFLDSAGSPTVLPASVIRSTTEEKDFALESLEAFHQANLSVSTAKLEGLARAAVQEKNIFKEIMEVSKCCSLGQISQTLYSVGGQYRRNM